MTTPAPIQPQSTRPADLVALAEKDFLEIASFVAAQSGRDQPVVEAHLRWFLLENPARRPEDPLGFGLRSADRLVGSILCSPQVFRCEKKEIRFMGSSMFYVDAAHRGGGGRIFLQYCRLGNRHPLFGTSANLEAAALWKAAGASPIPGSDCELFGVLRWAPIAEEVTHRRSSSRLLSRLAGSRLSGVASMFCRWKIDSVAFDALRPLASAEEVNDLAVRQSTIHQSSRKLTAARDLPYIRWRYFSGGDATTEVFGFQSHQPDRQVLLAVNQRLRGYRGQIKTLNVLDVYPEVSPNEWLRILGALRARYGTTVDAVVLRGQNAEQQRVLCERGFQRRAFAAPNGWFLDRSKLLPTEDWYPVPADGDGLI
jgi:hypothetical protein